VRLVQKTSEMGVLNSHERILRLVDVAPAFWATILKSEGWLYRSGAGLLPTREDKAEAKSPTTDLHIARPLLNHGLATKSARAQSWGFQHSKFRALSRPSSPSTGFDPCGSE